jgi:O-acetylserine/cysteine efflux transporter
LSPRDVLLALAVAAVWGLSFVAIRWSVNEVPPLLATALRYVAAVIPAVFFVRRPKVALWLLAGYGLAIGVGQFGLLFVAIKMGMTASLGALVIQLQAFFTIILAVAFLGERPRWPQLAGAGVAFAGIAVIATERLGNSALWPLLLSIGGAASWGLANTLTKRAGKIDMLGFVVWSSLVPPIPLYLLSLSFEGLGAVPLALHQLTFLGMGSLLFTGWASTVFGYGAWSVLIARYPASIVAPFTLLVPVTAVASGALLLGERITAIETAGSVLIFTGLLLNLFGARLFSRT